MDITSYNPFFLDQMKRDEEERKKMFQNMVQTGQTSPSPAAKIAEPPNLFANVFLPPPILPPPLSLTPAPTLQNDPVDMPTTTTRLYRQRTFGYYVSLSFY
jgi:hypothetical protein